MTDHRFLSNLLPRHSVFHARITIHQLDAVPFVSGQFAVRWKFKNVVSPHSARNIVKNRPKQHDDSSLSSRTTSYASSSSTPSDFFPFASNTASASRSTLHLPSNPSLDLPSYSSSRGNIPFAELKDHSVQWSYSLSTLLRLDVERDTAYLMPCPFKLVVMQHLGSDDPAGTPRNPRLGSIYLNLSEYVGQGPVDRRYLLRDSKTNATLKLSIDLEYISGETHYIPPPLAKGEILNGLSGYIKGEIYRTRGSAPELDMYGPYRDQQELELDLFNTRRPRTRPRPRTISRLSTQSNDIERGNLSDSEEETLTFDVERLPLAYGTKTTETLIESIFNPTTTNDTRLESPFTIYTSSNNSHHHHHHLDMDMDATTIISNLNFQTQTIPRRSEAASVYSAEESSSCSSRSMRITPSIQSGSTSTTDSVPFKVGSGSGSGNGNGNGMRVKHWWKRVASKTDLTTS